MNADYTTIRNVLTRERAMRERVFAREPHRRQLKVAEIEAALEALDRLAGRPGAKPPTQPELFT